MPPSRRTPPTRRPRVAGARSRNPVTSPREPAPPRVAGTAAGRTGGGTADTTETTNGGTADGGPSNGGQATPAQTDTASAPVEPGTGAGTEAGVDADTEAHADTETGAGDDTAAEPGTPGALSRRSGRRGRIATLVALVAVFLVAMTLAVWFRGEAEGLRATADTNNTALVNAQATAQVNSEVSAALETVYSYDHTKLDANQATAGEVITGQFTEDYRTLFAEVRQLAPQQQAVISATVVNSAVKVLDDDRAVLVVFLNQQGTKGITGEQIAAAGRLTVTAQQVDGQWKIAAVQNR